MLVKLLSQKSFLLQFFLGILFLALLFLGLSPFQPDLYSITAITLLLLTAVICLLFYNHSNLIKTPGFGLWFYLIWMLMFPNITDDLKLTLSLLISSVLLYRWTSAAGPGENRRILFETGFLISVSALLFPPSFFLIGFVLIAYPYTQPLSLKGILLLLIGLTFPGLICLQLAYLTGNIQSVFNYSDVFDLNFWNSEVWALVPVGLMILISWFDHISNFGTQNINKRHKYFLIFIYFINWLVILILFGGDRTDLLMFLGFPVSIFLSRFVQYASHTGKKESWLWIFAAAAAVFVFEDRLIGLYSQILGDVSFQL